MASWRPLGFNLRNDTSSLPSDHLHTIDASHCRVAICAGMEYSYLVSK